MECERTIHDLLRKRTAIAQDIDRNRKQLAELTDHLTKIEAALLVFGHEEFRPAPKPRHFLFKRNELRVHVLDQLRTGPKTIRELAQYAMDKRGLEQTRQMQTRAHKATAKTVAHLGEQGVAQSSIGPAGVLIWEMVKRT